MKNDITVDFLGIATEKGGTTWLGTCIAEHPEIYFSKNRELYFFNDLDSHFLKKINSKYQRGLDWYKSQFADAPKNSKKGDWSITYLYSKETSRRIYEHFPNIKMIASLRDPVKRTFSQYLYEQRLGFVGEDESFEEVLNRRPDYVEKGFYAKHLKNYYEYFDKEQVLVLIYEQVKKEPEKYIKQIFEFLEVENIDFISPSSNRKVNAGGTALFPQLNRAMISFEYFMRNHGFDPFLQVLEMTGMRNAAMKIRDINNKRYDKYPRINKKIEKQLYKTFKEDIEDLEKLLSLDFSIWKKH